MYNRGYQNYISQLVDKSDIIWTIIDITRLRRKVFNTNNN